MNVHVTAKDIAKGAPRVPWLCPVARALGRAGVVEPYVTTKDITGIVGLRTFWLVSPITVRGFVVAFDQGQPVKPFDFDLVLR